MTEHEQKSGIVRTLIDNSFLLIAGAVGALIWANMASPIPTGSDDSSAPPETSYTRFVDFDLTSLWSAHEDDHSGDDTQTTASPNATEQTDAAEETGEEKHGGHHGLTIHFVINDNCTT